MINLAWFAVLSMFHIFRGLCRGLLPSFILHMKVSLMKQSVAPESTSALMLAIALLVLIEMGICVMLPLNVSLDLGSSVGRNTT